MALAFTDRVAAMDSGGSLDLISGEDHHRWMDAVDHSVLHDVYHLPEYHLVAESQGEGRSMLFHYVNGPYTISLPLLLRPIDAPRHVAAIGSGWLDATSVYGYPGPLRSQDAIPSAVRTDFGTALAQCLTGMRVVTVFSRLNPLLKQQDLLAGLGSFHSVGQTVSIDLTLSEQEQWQQYRNNHRRSIARARRLGLSACVDTGAAYLEQFIDMYYASMRRVHASPRYFFPREYFHELLARLGDHIVLIVTLEENEVVAGGLFTLCDGIMQYHLGGTLDRALPLSPLKLTLDAARLWGHSQGLHVLHLGGGRDALQDSLFSFKAGFSDVRHEFRTWEWIVDPVCYLELMRLAPTTVSEMRYFPAYRRPDAVAETGENTG